MKIFNSDYTKNLIITTLHSLIIVGGIGSTATKIGSNPPAQSSGPSYSQVVQKPEVSESAGILEKVAFLWWWSNIL